jgi:uncharacterized zinc-type alcohol dehydrogenase-like protein
MAFVVLPSLVFEREPMRTFGYAATDSSAPLSPFVFERRPMRGNDVGIEIPYCGVYHTDLHFARNDWSMTSYPNVPGHEIVGRVSSVAGHASYQHRGRARGERPRLDKLP